MPIEPEAAIAKHSLLVAGHQTSISLEAIFWDALKREAGRRSVSVAALVAEIDAGRGDANLSSAIRVHLFRRILSELDASRMGHSGVRVSGNPESAPFTRAG